MNYEPNEIQRLILWRVIAEGGEEWLKDIKPELNKSRREGLVKGGLIEAEKRRNPKTKGTGLYVRVLDAGWQWAQDNMDASLPARSTAGGQVLQRVLTRLAGFMSERQIGLAELLSGTVGPEAPAAQPISPAPAPMPPAETLGQPTASTAGIADRIADACMKLTHGQANVRVRLAELRQRLADVPRSELDAVLLDMSREGKLSLYRLDNPQELQAEDHEAAVHTASGEPRHIVYFG